MDTGIQRHRDTEIQHQGYRSARTQLLEQRYMDIGIQRYRDTEIQHRDIEVQGHNWNRDTWTLAYRDTGTQRYNTRDIEVQGHNWNRGTWTLAYRDTGTQRYNTGI